MSIVSRVKSVYFAELVTNMWVPLRGGEKEGIIPDGSDSKMKRSESHLAKDKMNT